MKQKKRNYYEGYFTFTFLLLLLVSALNTWSICYILMLLRRLQEMLKPKTKRKGIEDVKEKQNWKWRKGLIKETFPQNFLFMKFHD